MFPVNGVVVAADIPDHVSRIVLSPPALPSVIGDSFAAQRKSAILVLPSALSPSESNWLINPLHPEFGEIKMRPPEGFHFA
jgi:RES domain-containing protein